MSYVWPESSRSTYLSPCFTTVPEKVWLSVPDAAVEPERDVEPAVDPDCGVFASGVCPGVCADGACCDEGGISGEGVGCVCGVCCVGVVSGADDGCCACVSGVVDGVVCAWSALPQEIMPRAIAKVAR